MQRKLVLLALGGVVAVIALVAWRTRPTTAQQPPAGSTAARPAPQLPITQVILFNSGVGYFQREGDVDGNARVDLSFQGNDINDLIKSLVLQDLGGGKISTISYDSQDPIDKTLKSFALDLTNNPTFGQILNQARGEKIELTMQQSNTAQPGTLTGIVVGMESKDQPAGKDSTIEIEQLNLLCTEGLRSVPLGQVQRVRFLNPILDSEFRRALEVLATTHDSQKKVVSLGFRGEGKRPVRVGYVVENPIWKTSYRLVLNKDGNPHLQGWAVVENTSDDDWHNVRMVLISGRPISFQMNLYQPLYIPRPMVEPELFASLRPPTYSGALNNFIPGNPVPGAAPVSQLGAANGPAAGLAGGVGGSPAFQLFNRYQLNGVGNLGGQFGNLGGQFGQQGGNAGQNPRLTYEELTQRRQQLKEARAGEKKPADGPATMDPRQGVASMATAEEAGDYFRYVIDQKVSLPRQKSAMLPIVDQPAVGTKVSIYNEKVQAKFPLLGLKFKNTSGQHLTQGPITIYEEGSYAGDTRVLDLQPNEERLISYAVDLGTEVKTETKDAPDQIIAVKLVKGVLRATHKLRETRTYIVKNRSEHERVLIIEHPIRADWKLVTPEKPSERSRDVYRFQLAVPAGKALTHPVVEEQNRLDRLALTSMDDQSVRFFITNPSTSPAVKEGLTKAAGLRQRVADTKRDLAHLEKKLKAITDDQTRLRANLDKVPPTSAAYKRYLEKFDTQETEIEKLQGQITDRQESEKQQQKEYEDFLAGLNVE